MALSGMMLINTIHQFWGGLETLAGNRLSMGFLFLYNLFTGSIKAKVQTLSTKKNRKANLSFLLLQICSNDDSHSIASILSQLLGDKQEYSILGSLLDIMARNPELCKKLPKVIIIHPYTYPYPFSHLLCSMWIKGSSRITKLMAGETTPNQSPLSTTCSACLFPPLFPRLTL